MKIKVLGSGSKGNSALIQTTSCNILIDAGISLKQINERIQTTLPNIDILIITHIHTDHTKYLNQIIKKYNPQILSLSKDIKELLPNKIIDEEEYKIKNTTIKLFKVSHDVECCGTIIKENNKELVYITDTGYLNKKILEKIKEKDIYILESNHDEEMLRTGSYPFYLQQRIRSDKGHLSNKACSNYLKKLINDNTKYIVLAHLSEENNKEELVEKEINNMLNQKPNKINKVYIAKQNESLETIEV